MLPIVLVTEIWIVIYNVYIACYNEFNISIFMKNLIKSMLFIKKIDLPNMWYMPVIIGIYLVLPFISIIIKKVDKRIIAIPFGISIILNMLLPNINMLLRLVNKSEITFIIDKSFIGSYCGIYIVLGYYLFKELLRNIDIKLIITLTISSTILTILYQYILLNNGINYDLWYNNILLFITSVGIYEIFLRIPNNINQFSKISCLVSKYSLGIYFLHIIIQNLLKPIINKMLVVNSVKALSLFICTFIISFVIIYSIKRFKFLQKYLFFVK